MCNSLLILKIVVEYEEISVDTFYIISLDFMSPIRDYFQNCYISIRQPGFNYHSVVDWLKRFITVDINIWTKPKYKSLNGKTLKKHDGKQIK